MSDKALITADRRLASLCTRVKVLEPLDWPSSLKEQFFADLRAGQPRNPQVQVKARKADPELREALREARAAVDTGHPAGPFLLRTADSHLEALALIDAAGTPDFVARSIAAYGAPGDRIGGTGPSNLEAARAFLARTELFRLDDPDEAHEGPAAAQWLEQALAPYFTEDPLPVELDPEISAKASAGASRVRIRTSARFSDAGLLQLLHHEALVHSATKRNGQAQPLLSCLGLSSPRTTATQEGLATLAELITDCMDIARLRRLALRTVAIDAALQGADFVAVFKLLLEAGQTEEESFAGAMRTFRGGDTAGRVAFTKDLLYLRGLLEVHTFLRCAIEEGRHNLPLWLFAGRLTLGDLLELEPLFQSGDLLPPRVAPQWVRNEQCLAAYLVWSAFSDQAALGQLQLRDFALA